MIIKSLLDLDFYKLTMMQAVLHRFPGTNVRYEFKCRNEDLDLSRLYESVKLEIDNLGTLKFSEEELEYLSNIKFFKKDFIEFLSIFRLQPKFVTVTKDPFNISIEGSWLNTILFETLILSIVNELYFKEYKNTKGKERLLSKMSIIKGLDIKFADFGTRRRFSGQWQKTVLEILKKDAPNNFVGTSNVLFARKLGLTPIGTMAHEFLQATQAMVRISESQKYALQEWAYEYRGNLGIALSDVVGIDAFLRDFDLYFSKLFDGLRHDSGSPFKWADKVINHYRNLGIDPKTKTLVFSDGLTFEKMVDIYKMYCNDAKISFGIGTNLTNDTGAMPISIVIKMVSCDNQSVAKISDSPGKRMCNDNSYLTYLKSVFDII